MIVCSIDWNIVRISREVNLPVIMYIIFLVYTACPRKSGTVFEVIFSYFSSTQQLFFFIVLDRTNFSHHYDSKIIKFGRQVLILWVISDGLSFSALFCPISRVLRHDNQLDRTLQKLQSIRNYSQNQKFPTKFDNLGVIITEKHSLHRMGRNRNCWQKQNPLKINRLIRYVRVHPPMKK